MSLQKLNKEQMAAVTAPMGPVCVLAGAGTGKTRVLTNRIIYLIEELGIDPTKILAMTFTKKATEEMNHRISKILTTMTHPNIATIHSFCMNVLYNEVNNCPWLRSGFKVATSMNTKILLNKVLNRLDISEKMFDIMKDKFFDFMKIEKTLKHLPNEVTTNEENFRFKEMYTILHSLYVAENLLTFDDMLFYTAKLFENDVIKNIYMNKYEYVLVDEYQDTSPLQFDIISTLVSQHHNLYVVGDNDQAIYGFRGADMGIILSFQQTYPEAMMYKLQENYRSRPNIIYAANGVISNNVNRFDKQLIPHRSGKTPIYLNMFRDGYTEAEAIAKKIKNKNYDDIAIIVRNNNMTVPFEGVFTQLNIPFVVWGDKKYFDREEVLDVMAYLEFIYDDTNYDAFNRIANKPSRFIGNATKNELITFCNSKNLGIIVAIEKHYNTITQNLRTQQKNAIMNFYDKYKRIDKTSLESILNSIFNVMEYDKYLNNIDDKEMREIKYSNAHEMSSIIDKLKKEGKDTLKDLISYCYFMQNQHNGDKENSVKIMTVHRSKGLEFKDVFLPAVSEEKFPTYYAKALEQQFHNTKGIEEERRLFYVAMTRAMNHLYISYHYESTTGNQYNISRFVREIDNQYLDISIDSLQQEEGLINDATEPKS